MTAPVSAALQPEPICQANLPFRPWADPRLARLPGLVPVEPGDWLQLDEAYAAQMRLREALLAGTGEAVLRSPPAAEPAARELLEMILAELADKPGFEIGTETVRCPDGRRVRLDQDAPLASAAQLVQEDLVVMDRPEGADEHVLTAAALCFPASWTLAEKLGRPLTAIHIPTAAYDADLARRVQRLFDGIRPGRPIWRANALIYADPNLHQPRRENDRRAAPGAGARWLRMERQTLVRLPRTGAVAFTIHTYVLPFDRLEPDDRAAFAGKGTVG